MTPNQVSQWCFVGDLLVDLFIPNWDDQLRFGTGVSNTKPRWLMAWPPWLKVVASHLPLDLTQPRLAAHVSRLSRRDGLMVDSCEDDWKDAIVLAFQGPVDIIRCPSYSPSDHFFGDLATKVLQNAIELSLSQLQWAPAIPRIQFWGGQARWPPTNVPWTLAEYLDKTCFQT